MSSDNTEALNRTQKVLIFVLGTLDELKRKGLLDGPDVMTPKAFEIFGELKAEGFEPTEKEREAALIFIQSGGLVDKH